MNRDLIATVLLLTAPSLVPIAFVNILLRWLA